MGAKDASRLLPHNPEPSIFLMRPTWRMSNVPHAATTAPMTMAMPMPWSKDHLPRVFNGLSKPRTTSMATPTPQSAQ
ncbi:GD16060 [Drosophila simulans]|uniref:GD16060 n=1 Tax=Drosophila simulans TaxID=7240 RepID=B4R745_DROSI|nr:GD16060 [Drosophila simulans]